MYEQITYYSREEEEEEEVEVEEEKNVCTATP
jgi:hypothetical protein